MLIKRWLAGVILGAGLLVFFRHDGIPLAAAGQNRSESNDVRFEVASIRLNKETWDTPRWRVEPGGRYRATRMPLRSLIQTAFAIERDELIGGPRWLATERFDIVAQATGELTTNGAQATFPGALRQLLNERFKLVVHKELRQVAVYNLKFARDDRRLGPGLSPSTVDCSGFLGPAPVLAEPADKRGRNPCAVSAPGAPGRYFAGSMPLTHLAGALRLQVGRPVIDQTGLEGRFKIELNWATETMPTSLSGLASEPRDTPLPSRDGPSIFTAVQEQLGLRLEAAVQTRSVIVIDSVEYPVVE